MNRIALILCMGLLSGCKSQELKYAHERDDSVTEYADGSYKIIFEFSEGGSQ